MNTCPILTRKSEGLEVCKLDGEVKECSACIFGTEPTRPMKPEGVFLNGDLWYGDVEDEEGHRWYGAVLPGDEWDAVHYGTEEVPEHFPLFVMTIFPDGTKESEAQEYFLAKRIGDARFGSACQHGRAKRGYCPDCLRKVL